MPGMITFSVLTTLGIIESLDLPQLETCLSFTMKNCITLKMLLCTSDIWSGNAKEDYITVVAHYITAD